MCSYNCFFALQYHCYNKAAIGGAVRVGTGVKVPTIDFRSQVTFSSNVATTSGGAVYIASIGALVTTGQAAFTTNTAPKVKPLFVFVYKNCWSSSKTYTDCFVRSYRCSTLNSVCVCVCVCTLQQCLYTYVCICRA
jgi:predicted outer membrane repeat protein